MNIFNHYPDKIVSSFGIVSRFVIAVLVVAVLAGTASAEPTLIDGPTTINQPGYYVLNASFTNDPSMYFITITASDVILDGNGHTIDGTDTPISIGVYVYNSSIPLTNVTVMNITTTDWDRGVYYQEVDDGCITSVTASSNGYGIYLYFSSNNTLTDNTASSNNWNGIHVYSSSGNTLTNNNAFLNVYYGIIIYSSSGNTLTSNNASSNNIHGIYLYSFSSNNTLTSNTASSNNQIGIYIDASSNNNTLTSNIADSNSDYGIKLHSSSSNTLTSNTASNNDRGIYLDSSSDNALTSNTASNNNDYGFYLVSSSSNNLASNVASSNAVHGGIYLDSSSDNVLTSNIALNNNWYGIALFSSSNNNTLTNNTASNTSYGGIYLNSSSYNILTGNNASPNNMYGIYLGYSRNNTLTDNLASSNDNYGIRLYSSSNNTLTNNTASNNNDYGIYLEPSSNSNTFTSNTVSLNDDRGIYLYSSSDNMFYNNFLNNNLNVVISGGSGNIWNTTKTAGTSIVGGPYLGGNYWATPGGDGFSQTATDVDGDEISDSPYINGNIADYLPLVGVAPNISIGYPSPGSVTGKNVTLMVVTSESATVRYSFSTDPYDLMSALENTGGTIHTHTLTGLSAGANTVYISARDPYGNTAPAVNVIWMVDSTRPQISLVLVNNKVSANVNSDPNIKTTITSNTYPITSVEYFIDTIGADGTGTSIDASGSLYQDVNFALDISSLDEGDHTFFIHAANQMGWGGYQAATFTKDTTAPVITITSPANGTNISDTTPTVTFTITDTSGTGIYTSSILVNGSTTGLGFNVSSDCTVDGTDVACTFTVSPAYSDLSTNTITVDVSDNAGNPAVQASTTFGVDTNDYITVNSVLATKTSALANGVDYWEYQFNITIGTTAGDMIRMKLSDWTGAGTIPVGGYASMLYNNSTGVQKTYNIENTYNLTQTVDPLQDENPGTNETEATIILRQIIPSGTTAGSYSTSYYLKSYS